MTCNDTFDDLGWDPALVATLRADLITRYDELAVMQRIVLELEADLAASRARERASSLACKAVQKRIEYMEKSTSWRITAPLRAIFRRLRRFRVKASAPRGV
jgi:hypothetical protein